MSVELERLSREPHAAALFAAAQGDPKLWDYLGYGPFEDARAYGDWVDSVADSGDPRFYAVMVDGSPLGVVSYLRDEPAHRVIEIGHIWFGPALQRTTAATETIYRLARHAFDELGYRRLEWKCDADNARSRRAADRFGFTFEGVFRQHMIVKGRNRDTAWYSIVDGEWPARRDAFEAWLAPGNFGSDGGQIRSLEQVREAQTHP